MPAAPSRAMKPGAGKGAASLLTRRVAGAPAYVWVGGLVVAIGVGLYFRRRSQRQTGTGAAGPVISGSGDPGSSDGGGGQFGSSDQAIQDLTDSIWGLMPYLGYAGAGAPSASTTPSISFLTSGSQDPAAPAGQGAPGTATVEATAPVYAVAPAGTTVEFQGTTYDVSGQRPVAPGNYNPNSPAGVLAVNKELNLPPPPPTPGLTPPAAIPPAPAEPLYSPSVQAAYSTPAYQSIGKVLGGGSPITYYTYKKNVPLGGGKTLAFTPGKGYYAK